MTATESISDVVSRLPPRARVVQAVKEWIDAGRLAEGQALPSERSLAKALDVSRVTVRAAFQQLIEEGLLDASGTKAPPRVTGTARGAHPQAVGQPGPDGLMRHTIAVLAEGQPARERVFLVQGWDTFVPRQAGRTFERHGYHVLNLNARRLLEGGLDQLLADAPAAMLAAHDAGESDAARQVLARCAAAGVPIVVCGDSPELAPYDRVEADHELGGYELTRWLLSQGRRRILRFYRFPEPRHWLARRDVGHERALREAGLEPLPPVRTHAIATEVGSADEFVAVVRTIAGYLVEHLVGPHPVDAIMCATDFHACEVNAALRLFGKRPNVDVLVTGFDNTWRHDATRQFEKTPPAATWDKLNGTIGDAAAGLLLRRIAGQLSPEPQRLILPGELVVIDPHHPAGGSSGGLSDVPGAAAPGEAGTGFASAVPSPPDDADEPPPQEPG